MGSDISSQDRNGQRGVFIDCIRSVQLVNLEAGRSKRIHNTLGAYASALVVPDVVNNGFVAGFQSGCDHGRAGQEATVVQVGAGIPKALGLVFFHDGLESGVAGVVAIGDDDALALSIINKGRESIPTGMAHDYDAVRFGGDGLFELIDHLLVVPA